MLDGFLPPCIDFVDALNDEARFDFVGFFLHDVGWLVVGWLLVCESEEHDGATLQQASGPSGITDVSAAILLDAAIVVILAIHFRVRILLQREPFSARKLGERSCLAVVGVVVAVVAVGFHNTTNLHASGCTCKQIISKKVSPTNDWI
jgi:drug/metabolite transporter (DMT)-like permease